MIGFTLIFCITFLILLLYRYIYKIVYYIFQTLIFSLAIIKLTGETTAGYCDMLNNPPPPPPARRIWVKRTAYALILTLCLAPMLLFMWIGTYSRPQSNDYCYILDARNLTLWDHLQLHRNGRPYADGRTERGAFTYIAVMNALTPMGIQITTALPAMLIAAWFATAAALLYKTFAALGLSRRRVPLAMMASALLVAATCASFFTIRSMYWYSASIKYGVPLILVALYLLLLLHVATRPQDKGGAWWQAALGGALCFFAAGSAETFSMVLLLALVLLLACRCCRERCLPTLAAGSIAVVAALLVMLTSSGLSPKLSASSFQDSDVAVPSVATILQEVVSDWLLHITHPALLPSFALMLAVGILVGLAWPRQTTATNNLRSRTSAIPLGISLVAQLLLLPILLNHRSYSPQLLGRYSGEYFIIIVLNVAMIVSSALLLYWRARAFERYAQAGRILPQVGLPLLLLMFVIATQRGMDWKSYAFFWVTMHCLLLVIAGLLSLQMQAAVVGRYAIGIGIAYTTMWLGALAVSFALNLAGIVNVARSYAYLPYLSAWCALAWGIYFGWGFRSGGASTRIIQIGALLVTLWLCADILVGSFPLVQPMRSVAEAFDGRHEQILESRATGQRDILISQPPVDLKVNLKEFDICIHDYYDIDSFTYLEN